MIRGIIAFVITYLFVMANGVYIMGGWDHQTVGSKLMSSFWAILLGAIVAIVAPMITKDLNKKDNESK